MVVTGKDKIIKTLKFHLEEGVNNKRPEIKWNLEDTKFDKFEIEPDMINDGSRFIVMNNEDTIVVGIYSVMVSFSMYQDYGIQVDKMMSEKIREILGFKRKF